MSTIAAVFDPEIPGGPGVSSGRVPAPGTAGDLSGDALAAAVTTVLGLGACSADYDALSDAEVLAGQRDLARLRHLVETRSVWMAKTLAFRSRPELGQQGLAAQQGFFTPDALIQKLTGVTQVDARKLVDVGRMLAETEAAQAAAAEEEAARRLLDETGGLDGTGGLDESADGAGAGDGAGEGDRGDGGAGSGAAGAAGDRGGAPGPLPWHAPISQAIADGALSVAAAHAIRTGLGDVDTVVTGQRLTDALTTLLTDAATMNADQLLKRARRMRDSLDEAGIAVREQKAWDDRYLRVWALPTGQICINGLFPPEQGQFIVSTFDSLTSPRRGGVRFVDPARAKWAQSVRDDPRSTDQLTADNFLDLLKAGTEVNPHRMLGGRQPAVRILTTATPTTKPTATQPGRPPGTQPVAQPGAQPAGQPHSQPGQPGAQPSGQPHSQPRQPGAQPSGQPAAQPGAQPISPPGIKPGTQLNGQPGGQPSAQPIGSPGSPPISQPSSRRGSPPHDQPGGQPSGPPKGQPTTPPAAPAPKPLTPTAPEPTAGPGLTSPPAPPATSLVLLRDPTQILTPMPDGTGHGYLEGNPAPLAQPTIDRLICNSGTITITIDPTGQPIDLGREERLFTPAQRLALAARDGGCRWGDCTKPPAHTEAHHIEHWARDHGATDLRLGILLCPAHHRLLHNQSWQIFEHHGHYWLRPPATIDPGQTLIHMPSKSPTTLHQLP